MQRIFKNNNMNMLINKFSQINSTDLKSVGGKNSSLGEMFNQLLPKGINTIYNLECFSKNTVSKNELN